MVCVVVSQLHTRARRHMFLPNTHGASAELPRRARWPHAAALLWHHAPLRPSVVVYSFVSRPSEVPCISYWWERRQWRCGAMSRLGSGIKVHSFAAAAAAQRNSSLLAYLPHIGSGWLRSYSPLSPHYSACRSRREHRRAFLAGRCRLVRRTQSRCQADFGTWGPAPCAELAAA